MSATDAAEAVQAKVASITEWWSYVFGDVWNNGFLWLYDGAFGGEMAFELSIGVAIALVMAAYFLCARAHAARRLASGSFAAVQLSLSRGSWRWRARARAGSGRARRRGARTAVWKTACASSGGCGG